MKLAACCWTRHQVCVVCSGRWRSTGGAGWLPGKEPGWRAACTACRDSMGPLPSQHRPALAIALRSGLWVQEDGPPPGAAGLGWASPGGSPSFTLVPISPCFEVVPGRRHRHIVSGSTLPWSDACGDLRLPERRQPVSASSTLRQPSTALATTLAAVAAVAFAGSSGAGGYAFAPEKLQ